MTKRVHVGAMQASWHRGYWLNDMTVQCFTGRHLRWSGFLGIPLLLITGLFVPLVSLGILLYHRKALDQARVRLRYGFIYRPYRHALSMTPITFDSNCILGLDPVLTCASSSGTCQLLA